MRRPLRQCADFAKWTLVIALVAFTLLLLAGRFVVNQLSFYQPTIEARLEQALGVPVSTGRVRGDWQGVLPLISLEAVQVGGDEPFLTMDRVDLEPDYLRSFLYRTLVVRQMDIDNLALSFKEDAQGRWALGSLAGAGRADIALRQRLLNSLTESQRIELRNTEIDLVSYSGSRTQLNLSSLTTANDEDFHRYVAEAWIGDTQNRISLVAETGNDLVNRSGRIGAAYLSVEGDRLEALLSIFAGQFQLDNAQADGEFTSLVAETWIDIFPDWTFGYSGSLQLDSLPSGSGRLNFGSSIAGSASYAGEIRVDFIDPVLELDTQELPLFDFSLSQQRGAQSNLLSFATNEFALGSFYSQLVERDLLSGRLAEVLAQLNPRGTVRNLLVDLDLEDPIGTLNVRGNLEEVDLDAFIRAPSVDNLSGYFEAGALQGFVQIDAEDIAPFYEGVYQQPFYHERMSGIVAWKVDPDRSAVEVFSDNLRIQGPEGDIVGAFRVEAPLRRRAFSTDLTVEIGLANSSSGHRMALVPATLPEEVRGWIEQSVLMGAVPQASFIYRGKLGRSPAEQTVQLNLAIREGELDFAPGWPALSRLNANLSVNNTDVSVATSRAYLRDIDISGAAVRVYSNPSARIEINSAFRGTANQVLDLIRDTPVRGRVGSGLDEFDFSGTLLGSVALDFPLRGSFPMEELFADISVDLSGNSLGLGEVGIQVDQLQGRVLFDESGLHADSITGSLWERPIELDIASGEQVRVDIATQIAVADIGSWLQTEWLDSLGGVADVQGEVAIGGTGSEQQTSYRFYSSLEGVTSDFPEPFAKGPDEVLELEVSSSNQPDSSMLTLKLEELMEVSLQRGVDGQIQQASLGVNAPAPPGQPGQLNGVVSLESLRVEDWTELLASSAGASNTALSLQPNIEVSSQDVRMGGRSFGALHALLNRDQDFWEIDFASVWGQGIYRFQASDASVPQLHFSELDLLAWQEQTGPSENTDPREIPRLDLAIDQLSFGERDFGTWSFSLAPNEEGVELLNIVSSRDDIRVVSEERATHLLWRFDGESHFTQMDMSLEFGDASQLFELLDQPSPITSDSGSLYSSFAWPGAPAEMLAQPLSGVMGIRLEDGVFDAEVEGVGSALMRVIGLFNISSWARRLQFDFSDVTSRGTSYDRVRGDFVLDEGVLTTLTPVDARLTSGRMRFDGQVDLNEDTVDAQLVATLPLRENMTWVTGLVAGLPAAAGVWLIGKLFEEEVDNLTSVSYRITGDLEDPDVRTERVLESTIGGG